MFFLISKAKLMIALRSCYYWEGVHLGNGKIDLEEYIKSVFEYLKKY